MGASQSTQKLLISIPLTFCAVIAYNDNVGSLAFVRGNSMQPTLNPSGEKTIMKTDILYVNKWIVRKNKFTRGSIYIFKSPTNPEKLYIKRLIAIEGDLIRTQDNHLIEIPKGHCWVEGDNRTNSIDSNTFGCIPLGLMYGKAICILFPFLRIGRIDSFQSKTKVVYKETSKYEDEENNNPEKSNSCSIH